MTAGNVCDNEKGRLQQQETTAQMKVGAFAVLYMLSDGLWEPVGQQVGKREIKHVASK